MSREESVELLRITGIFQSKVGVRLARVGELAAHCAMPACGTLKPSRYLLKLLPAHDDHNLVDILVTQNFSPA